MSDDGELRGTVAVVTGASRGIGRAICLAFAAAGADVVLAARSTEAVPSRLAGTIDDVAHEVEGMGVRALAVRTDVTDDDAIAALAARVSETFGRVDILVNNAAYMVHAPFAATPAARWDRVIDVTLGGAVRCTRAFLPQMLERSTGRIINVSSGAAVMALPDMASYAAAKAALETFTRCLATEVGDAGVAVNALRIDSAVATEGAVALNPEGDYSGWETPDAIAQAVLWIARQDRAYTGRIVASSEVRG
jgi:NAD(P)-dependent dehydrogenase (short-subunit alcohol dehydrogenase family)